VSRRPVAVLLAGLLAAGLGGLAGCGDRDPATSTGEPRTHETSIRETSGGDVETAVQDAEELLASIDAELEADAAETG
jgi:hypothetical protein